MKNPSGADEKSTGHPSRNTTRGDVIKRRSMSISVVTAVAIGSLLALPLALPVLVVADLLRLRFRLPLVRLYMFAICWSWLETAGVSAAGGIWLIGRARDRAIHYRLQAWWADRIMGALRVTCGLRPDVAGADELLPGPTILFVRHASLADSLLTAWVITHAVGMSPRVVMKRELLVDPCLDIVGNRLPNCFVDRSAVDSAPELAAIRAMALGLREGEVAVLFPEGTRANPAKRERALAAIGRRDPARAGRMAPLEELLPPRPAGAATLMRAVTEAQLCVGWHVGFEGLDTFSGIIAALGRPRSPVRIRLARIQRPPMSTLGPLDQEADATDSGAGGEFVDWLDELWLDLDRRVQDLLAASRR